MFYLLMMALFSFGGHLASMGPKTKEREHYGVFGGCIKATGMMWERIYQHHFLFPRDITAGLRLVT